MIDIHRKSSQIAHIHTIFTPAYRGSGSIFKPYPELRDSLAASSSSSLTAARHSSCNSMHMEDNDAKYDGMEVWRYEGMEVWRSDTHSEMERETYGGRGPQGGYVTKLNLQ